MIAQIFVPVLVRGYEGKAQNFVQKEVFDPCVDVQNYASVTRVEWWNIQFI